MLLVYFVVSKESISRNYHMSFVFYLHGIQKHKVFDTNGYTKWCLVFTCRKCRGNLSYKFLYLFRHVCLAEKLTSYYVWQRTATTIYMERYMKNGRNKSSKSRYLKIEVGCNIIHHNIILRIWLLHSPSLPQNRSLLNNPLHSCLIYILHVRIHLFLIQIN